MDITEIDFLPVTPSNGLVAFVSFTINHSFHVNNVALRTTPDSGIRLTYPQTILPNGIRKNDFYPINKQTGEFITSRISAAYNSYLEKVMKGLRHEAHLTHAAA